MKQIHITDRFPPKEGDAPSALTQDSLSPCILCVEAGFMWLRAKQLLRSQVHVIALNLFCV